MSTKVSEEHIAAIFRAKNNPNKKLTSSTLDYSSILKMDATCSSETLVDFQQAT
jgi:hypothetical protein